ncbi:MAG: nucleotidyl transferase AbiEii/AbiGii toxin family protein [Caldilineales bacterium]
MNKPAVNLATSVHQRLLNESRSRNVDFNLLLARFASERLLYRLAQSPFADRFVLKGAMMLQIWLHDLSRPTRDLDLLGFGDLSGDRLRQIFSAICDQAVESDGVTFAAGR